MLTINTDKPYRIYAEHLEQGALDQFESAMNCDFAVQGALMPDSHFGYSLPIGAVVATKGVIVPAWVGYDIGCGMCAIKTTFAADAVRSNAKQIFDDIYATVPVGFNHHKTKRVWEHAYTNDSYRISETTSSIFERDGLNQIGTLGGGNHFIEIGEATEANIWIIVHSGSRGIGHAVATHYMRLASGDTKAREGHFGLDVTSDDGVAYIGDLIFCLHFALENRRQLIQQVSDVMSKTVSGCSLPDTLINRNHNHAEPVGDTWVHRKGATHAELGMLGVIPGNMRDGSFIVCGKGCVDSLCSSSHGAGRVLGRKEAQRVLNMETFNTSMSGVTAKIDQSTLDESPLAYKNIFDVMLQQKDLVEVITHVRPIINIKG